MTNTTPTITPEMIAGWTWDANVLRAPNGRIHVLCRRSSFETGRGERITTWTANVAIGAWLATSGVLATSGLFGGYRGHSGTCPSRGDAVRQALANMLQAKDSRLPEDADVAGLHPFFTQRLREVRTTRARDAAASALATRVAELDRFRKLLQDLPGRIAEAEAALPALTQAAKDAQAAVDALTPAAPAKEQA